MAQRKNRSSKGTKNNPDLRTGGGRRAKAERAEARRRSAEHDDRGRVPVRMRPGGAVGMAWFLIIGALIVAAVVYAALWLDRWNVVSYPDTLWMFVAFGLLTAAPSVGRVSRTVRDADLWGALALLLPASLFAIEAIAGPGCPTGADCATVGARGSLGIIWSIVLILLVAVVAWALARWQYRASYAKRPPHGGHVTITGMAVAMFGMLLFPGIVIGAATVGADWLLRDMPKLAVDAREQVERECYGLTAAPSLEVRSAPQGYNSDWMTFAVRRADEDRKGIKGAQIPKQWATLDIVHPYEATVSFTSDGQLVNVACRRVGPGTGNAVPDDLAPPVVESNPLSPKTTGQQFLPRFFTQGQAGPTEEGKKLIAERKKAEAAAKKADETKADTADKPADDAKPAAG
jgi:hypothetical protein